ncbi:GtrA family protein [Sneathiella sp.]|uniref:GtrA family protein n=1 Tax=Sneathiella sp. TaxID=1964365 RepID=UPI0035649D9E
MNSRIATLWGKGWRFIVTGILSNVLFYCLFLVLLWLSVPYQIALTVIYILGMIFGYLVNKYWSWKDKSPVFRSAGVYILIYGIVYVCHLGFVSYLVKFQAFSPALAALISFVCLTIPLFMLLDKLVYRSPKTIT